jgi:hypothetical protein
MGEIDEEISVEFQCEPDSMPIWVHYLFAGQLEDLLQTSVLHQLKWIDAIRKARNMQRVLHQCQQQATWYSNACRVMTAWLNSGRQ